MNNKEENIIVVSKHRLNLAVATNAVIKKAKELASTNSRYAFYPPCGMGYNGWDDYDDGYYDDEYFNDDWKRYWNDMGFGCTNEEWQDFQDSIAEYESSVKNFECVTGHKIRNICSSASSSHIRDNRKNKSTKFINGIEVDDDTFDEYNERRKKGHNTIKRTRRSGRKHKGSSSSNYTTEYINGIKVTHSNAHRRRFDDSDISLNDPLINDEAYVERYEDALKNEKKNIIFYRNLPDGDDVYTFNNLFEFNEWLENNDITVNDENALTLMYGTENHCCLNPDTTSKELIVNKSYGDLIYDACNGDVEKLYDGSVSWEMHGV